MTEKRNHKILEKITLDHIAKSTFSLKTASTEVIGTNRKHDVMRVLRTLHLIDYNNRGNEHIILELGHRYFVSDERRRKADMNLFPYLIQGESWEDNFGSEIFMTGRNALQLKRDYFDDAIMMLIDPPKQSRRNGLRIDALLNNEDISDSELLDINEVADETSELDYEFVENKSLVGIQSNDKWIEIASRMAASGNEAGARALAYLTRPRTMSLINELGKRVGINLKGEGREDHLYRFCSFRMRDLLKSNSIFLLHEMQDAYLDSVAELTIEKFLGFNPYSVSSTN